VACGNETFEHKKTVMSKTTTEVDTATEVASPNERVVMPIFHAHQINNNGQVFSEWEIPGWIDKAGFFEMIKERAKYNALIELTSDGYIETSETGLYKTIVCLNA